MTPYDLKTEALRETGILEKTETAGAEEFAIATSRYELLHAMLLHDGLATWAYTEDIPDRCAVPVIWMLANVLATLFGVPVDRKNELQALGGYGAKQISLGERQLRKMQADRYVPQPALIEYF